MVAMATSSASLDSHRTHDFLGQSEPTTQTAPRSVQSFCRAQQCDKQTDKPTDHATRSATISYIYVRNTATRPNNNIVMQAVFL